MAVFRELTDSLRNNKLRTFLTGFTVAWGIIILVVMMGAGQGIENGLRATMESFGGNQARLKVTLGRTQLPYAGFQEGRELYLLPEQMQLLEEANQYQVNSIEPSIAGLTFLEASTTYGSNKFRYQTLTLREQEYNLVELERGRLFTQQEHEEGARVLLLCSADVSKLFRHDQDPLGAHIEVEGVLYTVVGLVKPEHPFFSTYTVPYNTYVGIYPNHQFKIRGLSVYPKSSRTAEAKRVKYDIEHQLKTLLQVSPDDQMGISTETVADFAEAMDKIFVGLTVLLWLMGIGSLSIGTIGVSNIMYVTVQERMREIGIRKALGAKPRNILQMVLGESVLLALASGLVGLVIGLGLVEVMNYLSVVQGWGRSSMKIGMGWDVTFNTFEHPQVSLAVAVSAVIVLVIAGIVAGYGPAKKAVKIPAVVAMRDNK